MNERVKALQAKITKTLVERTKPEAKDLYIWDTDLKGFGLKITPAGRRAYVIQYRIGGRTAPSRRMVIGTHGTLTTEQARKEAKTKLAQTQLGNDPMSEREHSRKDITVNELCDRYLADGCGHKKPTTVAVDQSNIERHIRPLIGKKRIRSLRANDIERLQKDIANGKTSADQRTGPRGRAIVTGGRGIAARSIALLSAMLSFAERHGLIDQNPAKGVKLYKVEKRNRYLTAEELVRLGEALYAEEVRGANPYAIAAIRTLLLSGCRKSEVLTLRWENVDLVGGFLNLPDSKTGAKSIPIGKPVVDLLRTLPRTAGNSHVFPGNSGGHLVDIQRVWNRVREAAGLPTVRLHDLRHTYASSAAMSGIGLPIIGRILGHSTPRTTDRYVGLADDPVRASADAIATSIQTHLTHVKE